MSAFFFCENSNCNYKIFTERFPDLILPYCRNTERLIDFLRVIAFNNSGEEGSRILKEIGIKVSPVPMIRMIRKTPKPVMKVPETIGIDDWAFRKGASYKTIIINNETGNAFDLLPDRKTETVELWKEICSQEFKGAYTTVKYFIKPRSKEKGKVINFSNYSKKYLKTSKETAFIIQKDEKNLKEKEKEFRDKLFKLFPEIVKVSEIVKEFKFSLKERNIDGFLNSVEKIMKSEKELGRFAKRLKKQLGNR